MDDTPPPPVAPETPLLDATETAIAAATHLTDLDQGAVEALRTLARRIDLDDRVRESWLDYQVRVVDNPRPLQIDNVSIPTYLKYCESLGLTPTGRTKLAPAKEAKRPRGGLASIQGAAGAARAGGRSDAASA